MSEARQETELCGRAKILCMCGHYETADKVEGAFFYGAYDCWDTVLFRPDEPFVCPECEADDNWAFDEAEPEGVEETLLGTTKGRGLRA